jgi:hypothetical protein
MYGDSTFFLPKTCGFLGFPVTHHLEELAVLSFPIWQICGWLLCACLFLFYNSFLRNFPVYFLLLSQFYDFLKYSGISVELQMLRA